jgi:NADH-quinone oxidoreductase subunit K
LEKRTRSWGNGKIENDETIQKDWSGRSKQVSSHRLENTFSGGSIFHDIKIILMPINYYIFLSIALFCIGVAGVLTRRNAIIIFMCIELMLNAVNLLLIAFSKMHHATAVVTDPNAGINGQIFVFFIMVVAAAEVSVGLAIIAMMYRNTHSVDINFLNRLKH